MTKIKVKFNRNVKFNSDLYVIGQSVDVSKEQYDELLTAGVIYAVEGVETLDAVDQQDDLFTLSREELEKVNKADIVKFMKAKGIDFDEKAKKEDLVELIVGD